MKPIYRSLVLGFLSILGILYCRVSLGQTQDNCNYSFYINGPTNICTTQPQEYSTNMPNLMWFVPSEAGTVNRIDDYKVAISFKENYQGKIEIKAIYRDPQNPQLAQCGRTNVDVFLIKPNITTTDTKFFDGHCSRFTAVGTDRQDMNWYIYPSQAGSLVKNGSSVTVTWTRTFNGSAQVYMTFPECETPIIYPVTITNLIYEPCEPLLGKACVGTGVTKYANNTPSVDEFRFRLKATRRVRLNVDIVCPNGDCDNYVLRFAGAIIGKNGSNLPPGSHLEVSDVDERTQTRTIRGDVYFTLGENEFSNDPYTLKASVAGGSSDIGRVAGTLYDYTQVLPIPELNQPDVSEDGFVASWQAVPDAKSYRLEVSTDPSFSSLAFLFPNLITLSQELTDLDNTKTYYFRVLANLDCDITPYSSTLKVNLLPCADQDFKVSFTALDKICATEFTAHITNPNNRTYTVKWDFGDGTTGTGNSIQHTFPETRPAAEKPAYNVTLTVEFQVGKCKKIISVMTSKAVSYTKPVMSVDFNHLPSFCTTLFEPRLSNPLGADVVAYKWKFAELGTSTEKRPIFAFPRSDTYQVTLEVVFPAGCNPVTVTKDVVINLEKDPFPPVTTTFTTDLYQEVINASAVTFSDEWTLEQPIVEVNGQTENLQNWNGYLNATQGVWRADASYVYDEDRKAFSDEHGISKAGTFTLEGFNWQHSNLEDLIDWKWRKANSITQYSAYGFELENKDILDRYSSALYDYNGQFPTATGVNMRKDEMAFTSFEHPDDQASGNWQLSQKQGPLFTYFRVLYGVNNFAIVNASMEQLRNINQVDIEVRSFGFFRKRVVQQVNILCKKAFSQDEKYTLISFDRRVQFEDVPWSGRLVIRNTVTPDISTQTDDHVAHSGKKSLKISQDKTLEQQLLKLTPGKRYLLSAWVSVNEVSLPKPSLGTGMGIRLVFKTRDGAEVLNTTFRPSGRIVEGWQQITGEFVAPTQEVSMFVSFLKRTDAGKTPDVWYDDLRLHPVDGNMQSYVYDPASYRLQASLDENNFGSFFYYDEEGRLYLTKKETEEGIKTIAETVTHTPKH